MKRPVLTLVLLISIALPTFGQNIFEFENIDREKLASIEGAYTAAIDSRPEVKCAFPNQEEAVTKNWQTLQDSFREYLSNEKFSLPSGTRFFIRYYFDKAGVVEYIGYKMHSTLSNEAKAAFEKQLMEFAGRARFGMIGSIAYTQCGVVKLD